MNQSSFVYACIHCVCSNSIRYATLLSPGCENTTIVYRISELYQLCHCNAHYSHTFSIEQNVIFSLLAPRHHRRQHVQIVSDDNCPLQVTCFACRLPCRNLRWQHVHFRSTTLCWACLQNVMVVMLHVRESELWGFDQRHFTVSINIPIISECYCIFMRTDKRKHNRQFNNAVYILSYLYRIMLYYSVLWYVDNINRSIYIIL